MKYLLNLSLLFACLILSAFSAFGQDVCVDDAILQRMLDQVRTGRNPAVDQALRKELLEMRDGYVNAELFGTENVEKIGFKEIFDKVSAFGLLKIVETNGGPPSFKIEPLRMTAEIRDAFLGMGADNVSGVPGREQFAARLAELANRNTVRMCKIFSEHGWPGISLVDIDGVAAAVYLLKKSPAALQEKLLDIVNEGIRKNEVPKNASTAALLDAALVRKKVKQKFGTQASVVGEMINFAAMDDIKLVEERRKEYGLGPVFENLRRIEIIYKMPTIITPSSYHVFSDLRVQPGISELEAPQKNARAAKKTNDSGEDDDEPIKVDSSLVSLDMMVLDAAEKFDGELTMKDFVVYENGVKQEAEFFSSTDAPYDLVLLIDVSNSAASKIDLLRRSTGKFIDFKRPKDRLAIIAFDNGTNIISPWASDKKLLIERAEKITGRGGSQVWRSLQYALTLFDKTEAGRRKAVVMMSDGGDDALLFANGPSSQAPRERPFAELLEAVRRSEIPIFPVYLDTENDPAVKMPSDSPKELAPDIKSAMLKNHSNWIAMQYKFARKTLQQVAEESGGRYYKSAKLEDLDRVYRQVLSELGKVYTIGYSPANDRRDGAWREVRVEVPGHPSLIVSTRPGYYAK